MKQRITLFMTVLLAAPAAGQLAASPGYRLGGLEDDAGRSSSCSTGYAAFAQLEGGGQGGLASANYQAQVGFLVMYNPKDTRSPDIFAVAPNTGPMEAETQITICGFNFVKQGLAGSVSVDIGGVPATGVTVVSDTTITATTPTGISGPKDVMVTTALESGFATDAYIHTPALTITPSSLGLGATADVKSYGPSGGFFDVWFSPFETSLPFGEFGTLFLGPAPILPVVSGLAYPPGGVHVIPYTVPQNPNLIGLESHFQSVSIVSFVPLDVRLTNLATINYQ